MPPSTSQRPFGGAHAEADVTVLTLPLLTADHCCGSIIRSPNNAPPIRGVAVHGPIWSLSVPCLWQLQPLCALLIQDVSLLIILRISLPGLLSQCQLSLSRYLSILFISLYFPFPAPFITLNYFSAPSPLLWPRQSTAWTDTVPHLFSPTVV